MKLYAKKELKEYMIKHKFQQSEMAKGINMRREHIHRIVNRKRYTRPDTAHKIIKYMMLNLNRFVEFFEWR